MSNKRRAFEDKITNPNFRRKINVSNTGSIMSKNENPYEDYNNKKISSLNNNPNAFNDPFGSNKKKLAKLQETPVQKTNKIILTKLKQARQSGTIDISNLKLEIIPKEVFDLILFTHFINLLCTVFQLFYHITNSSGFLPLSAK